jgi:hypothetical protein
MADNVKWKDSYDVLDPSDFDTLDSNAAVHEFRGGLTQDQAASKAHEEYLKNHAIDSAAHHYLGARAAVAAHNQAAAKQHGQAYIAAMSHLGLDATTAPPKEVLDRIQALESNPYSFKAHKADRFFTPEVTAHEPSKKERLADLIEKIKQARAQKTNPNG